MFWTQKHQIESSNHEGFFKNFPCCRQFLQEFYKVQTNFVGFFHARCLNFPCFINYLAACMHAFCMFYLYVSLGETFTCSHHMHFLLAPFYNVMTGTFDLLWEILNVLNIVTNLWNSDIWTRTLTTDRRLCLNCHSLITTLSV